MADTASAKSTLNATICKTSPRAMDSLSQVMFKFTNYVMLFAPIGVGAAMAHTIGTQGPVVLLNLGKLIGSLYLALVIFIALIFGLVIRIWRIPLRQFVRAVREPAVNETKAVGSDLCLTNMPWSAIRSTTRNRR
jgi:proton glutamate symport protein